VKQSFVANDCSSVGKSNKASFKEKGENLMAYVKEMLQTHPLSLDVDENLLESCIRACYACAQSCTACADACLGEDMVAELVLCIRLNLDCADVCATTGRILSRQTTADWNLLRAQLEACLVACRICGDECASHADMHEHCRVCAEACVDCAESCQRLLDSLA
jgi:hypothetical protein